MKILVYGINYSPELVEWMASQGHEVRVITAPPYYPQWQVGENYSPWRYRREEGAATVWRCPLYVPKQPSTLKRLIHLGSFAVSGSHHRCGADTLLHAGYAPAGKTLRRAHPAAYSGLRSGCDARPGHGR